jgi:translation initiation factor 2 subunit gamma (aeIF-2g)
MKVPKQPELNIGLIGHVDHGKTTLTKALTGEWTDRHSEEIKRGVSIKLGYADAALYRCKNCSEPECYTNTQICPRCGGETELQRAISFVDSPGHETLMAVMLSGAAVMNGALLTIAANEHCPQPQTREHLKALEILGIRDIVIVQTKIDLVSGERVKENYEEIKEFTKGSIAENSIIIPVSAYYNVNIDVLIKAIIEQFSLPDYYEDRAPLTSILRSFDVNRPGTKSQQLRGGIIGGSLTQGLLKIGDEIEIRQGIKKEEHNKVRWDPLYTRIISLRSGELELESARSGGLIAIGTSLDPSLTKADGLVGQTLGKPGSLPEILNNLSLGVSLLEKVIGLEEDMPVEPIKSMEPLMLSVGSATTVGIVKSARGDVIDVNLRMPVCPMKKQRVAISRRFGSRWRLIGYGIIK